MPKSVPARLPHYSSRLAAWLRPESPWPRLSRPNRGCGPPGVASTPSRRVIRLVDTVRIPVMRGPYGQILQAVERATLFAKITLMPGRYRIVAGGCPLEPGVEKVTEAPAGIAFVASAP